MPDQYRYPDHGERLTVSTIQAIGVDGAEWDRQEAEILDRFADGLAGLTPRQRFLDYGSGEGRLCARFVGLFDEVIAYEPDDVRRAIHAERLGDDRVSLLARFDRDVSTGAYDAALCSHVIQHIAVDTVETVLLDLATALRRGAPLLLSTTIAGPDRPRYAVSRMSADGAAVESDVDAAGFAAACLRNTRGELPIHFYGLDELLRTLDRHGLDVVEMYGLHRPGGVVGPLARVEAAGIEDLFSCRDVAVIATRA